MTRSASPKSHSASPIQQLPEHLLSPFSIFLQSLDPSLSDNTKAAYRRDVLRYLEYLEAQSVNSFEEVGPEHVRGLIDHLRNQGLSASSLNRNTSSVRQFHRFLQTHGLCHHDPAQRVATTQPATPRSPNILSEAEARRLVEAMHRVDPLGLRNRAILEVLYASGVTASELVRMRVGDVLLKQGMVHILGKAARQRTVPMGEPAIDALSCYLRDARPELLKLNADDTDVLFLNARGRELSRMSVWKIIKSAARTAGIGREISPHTLRHTFAAHLVSGGADVRDVQHLLGNLTMSTILPNDPSSDPIAVEAAHRAHPRS